MAPPPPSTAILMTARTLRNRPADAAWIGAIPDSPPAAHVEDRAGDVGRFIVEEPEDRRGDFLRVPCPPERRRGAELVGPLRLAIGRMDLGEDHARPHADDAHPVRTDFLRQADG